MFGQHHGESVSSWMNTTEMSTFSSLIKDEETDVCIVGAGLAGLTIAYQLLEEGRKVIILESFEVGSGQSSRSTAHLTYCLDERYYRLEKIHGEAGIKLIAQSHQSALKRIKEIIEKENIDCELERVNGYLFCASDELSDYDKKENKEKSYRLLNLELDSLARAGLSDVYLTEKIPLHSFDPGPALCFPDQLEFNPIKYMKALAEIIEARGGKIFTNSHVVEVKGGDHAYVKVQNEKMISCENIVVASNTPVNDLVAIHTKQMSYRTYVIALEVPKDVIIKGLYWDDGEPYHFIRLEKGPVGSNYEILLVGGEDHKTGQNDHPQDCYTKLETWARKRIPQCARVLNRWSGQVIEPNDCIAYIGKNPLDRDNVFIVTGHSGNGTTYSTIAALVITDLILERKNPWSGIYHPSRISLSTTGTYFRENVNTLAQYKDWFKKTSDKELSELNKCEGLVYRDGLHRVAAYKDEHAHLTLNSAVCSHLGGIVRWNAAEKSWDCPCHGSRFDCYGKVLEGPAINDLAVFKEGALHPPDLLKVIENQEKLNPLY